MKFVTIKESHNETDLLVLKGRLESEGIRCFLRNEFSNQIMTHMATFSVELQVASEDLERATQILQEVETS